MLGKNHEVHSERDRRPEFSLSPAERMLWGVRFEDGVLRLRATGPTQVVAVVLIGVGAAFAVIGVLAGSVTGLLAAPLGVAVSVGAVYDLFFAAVVASPDCLVRHWFGIRRIPWDTVDFLEVVDRRRAFPGRGPIAVIEVALRDGSRVTLWPTSSSREGLGGATDPSAAMLRFRVLQRYRELAAPPP